MPQSLDGLERLTGVRFLYLDHNALPEDELLRLPGGWAGGCWPIVSGWSECRLALEQRLEQRCIVVALPGVRTCIIQPPSQHVLPELLPSTIRLETLDVVGNPGCTPAVEAALQASGLLAHAHFFNGQRLRR